MVRQVCFYPTLLSLHTDLMGRIYREFDPQSPETTIPSQLESWMREKNLIRHEHPISDA